MAVRTNSEDVLAIMGNPASVDEDVVDSLITAASAFVDNVFAEDTSVGDVLLTEIEKWFTAHMIASSLLRTTQKEKLGDAEVNYVGKYGENLSSTPYGQMVLTLDVSGKMGNIGRRGVSLTAITSFDE